MGTSKSKPRASDAGYTGVGFKAFGIGLNRFAHRTANKAWAEGAQKEIEERHAKKANPKPERGHSNRKYSAETIAAVKAMWHAGWPPREIARVYPEIKASTLPSILYNAPDGMSAARAKGRYD